MNSVIIPTAVTRGACELLTPAHATPSLTHTTRAIEAIGQTRVLCPELQEVLILRFCDLEAIGQMADLFLELLDCVTLLLLLASVLCAFFPEHLPQSLLTQLFIDEIHGQTRHGLTRHFDTEKAVLYMGLCLVLMFYFRT